jgi:integrase
MFGQNQEIDYYHASRPAATWRRAKGEPPMQIRSEFATTTDASIISSHDVRPEGSSVRMASFIETKFIPDHVEHKSFAGRTHYQAILKHILKPETVERMFTPYMGAMKARLRAVPGWPYLDDVKLCELAPDHIRQLTASASAHVYSPQTIKHIRNVVGAIISHARRERLFSGDNPVCDVKLPPMVRRESKNLTIAQVETILGLMKYPEREIALITIATGMSISEICALQWKHVNLTASAAYIEGEFLSSRSIKVKRQWSAGELMDLSHDRVRNVIIPESLREHLKKMRPTKKIIDQNEFVISTRDGRPISPSNILLHGLKPIGCKLDMPWLSWQVLKRAQKAFMLELTMKYYGDLGGKNSTPHWASEAGRRNISQRPGTKRVNGFPID